MYKKIGIIMAVIIIITIILSILTIKKDESKKEGFTGAMEEPISLDESLKAFGLNINGITKEVTAKIGNNKDNFFKSLKEYMYKKGLVEGDQMTLQQYIQEEGKLKLRFTIEDPYETRLIATIDSNDNYEFFYYK